MKLLKEPLFQFVVLAGLMLLAYAAYTLSPVGALSLRVCRSGR